MKLFQKGNPKGVAFFHFRQIICPALKLEITIKFRYNYYRKDKK